MARVWFATDVRHQRAVALKVLRPELALSGVADRFLREVRVLADLQHPHILALLDSGLVPVDARRRGDLPLLRHAVVRGESLRERLTREGPLPLDDRQCHHVAGRRRAGLCAQAWCGASRREAGKHPARRRPGLSRRFRHRLGTRGAAGSRLTETGLTLGTPAYMSPEQAAAERHIDGRSDQYGLACVVYEMLAGEPPFTGPTAQAIIAKRLAGPAPSIGVLRPSLPRSVPACAGARPWRRRPPIASRPPGPSPRRSTARSGNAGHAGHAAAALRVRWIIWSCSPRLAGRSPARTCCAHARTRWRPRPGSAARFRRDRIRRARRPGVCAANPGGDRRRGRLYSRAIARDSGYAPGMERARTRLHVRQHLGLHHSRHPARQPADSGPASKRRGVRRRQRRLPARG